MSRYYYVAVSQGMNEKGECTRYDTGDCIFPTEYPTMDNIVELREKVKKQYDLKSDCAITFLQRLEDEVKED